MRGLLVRVGIDSKCGRWNAPVDPDTGRYVYVPIPERAENVEPGMGRSYEEVVPALAGLGVDLPDHLHGQFMHLDPDFEHLTYGDGDARANPIRGMTSGDFLVFWAGLRPICKWDYRIMCALIGLYVVQEVVPATSIPAERRAENAHTRRKSYDGDVVVRALPARSGRFERCVPFAEYRKGAYRVRPEILDAWGGLSVRNGYIQRSGRLPGFHCAELALAWIAKESGRLIANNNL
jgi:hypothetical protein